MSDLDKRAREYLTMNAAESGADVLIAEMADEIAKYQRRIQILQSHCEILHDMLLNPDPDQEPDNIRLHREKCDALDRALKAEAQLASARKALEEIQDLGEDGATAARLSNIARVAITDEEGTSNG